MNGLPFSAALLFHAQALKKTLVAKTAIFMYNVRRWFCPGGLENSIVWSGIAGKPGEDFPSVRSGL